MKAAVLYGNEDLRWCEYPEPEVKPGTVKIKVRAVGICGSDIPRVFMNKAHFYPIVLGHEFSGEIVETGSEVKTLKVGDRVAGIPLLPCFNCIDCMKGNYSLCKNYSFIGSREQGAFAEYIVVPEQNAIKVSDSLSYEMAAMFEPSTVALHSIRKNNYRGGGTVAIIGSGTIGLFVMLWAKIFGANKTVVFDMDVSRMEIAKRLGADDIINVNEEGFIDKARTSINDKGFDYVFDAAGNSETMNMAFKIAKNKAHVCFIGTPVSDVTFTPSQIELMYRKEFMLTGSWMSYSIAFPGEEWQLTSDYSERGLSGIENELIFKRLPMSEAWEGFKMLKTPGLVKGKIMLLND